MSNRIHRYAIRKLSIGAASVLVGVAFMATSQAGQAQASTAASSQQQSGTNQASHESISASETHHNTATQTPAAPSHGSHTHSPAVIDSNH